MSPRAAGRTRVKLARLLTEALSALPAGPFLVSPDELYPASGAYRTNRLLGCECPWTGYARAPGSSLVVDLSGYSTMTECCAHGVQVHVNDRPLGFDVYAKKPDVL